MKIKKFLSPKLYRVLKELPNHSNIVKYKKEIEKNIQFKNKHLGQRCFILGNGPSLKKIDFSKLQNEITFTVNQLPRNPQFSELKTDYHFWADRLFFEIKKDNAEDRELLNIMKAVNAGKKKPVVFYDVTAAAMIERFKLYKDIDIAYFQATNLALDVMLKKKLDFTQTVPGFPTVVHYAICMAVYMGFAEIYLLGCDCTGFINIGNNRLALGDASAYGYSVSETERVRMAEAAKQRKIQNELMSYAIMFDVYEQLGDYCKANNVKLYNATEGSLLESIPQVHLEDIL